MLDVNSITMFGTLFSLVFSSATFGALFGIPQYFLCKVKSRWLGLLLPSLTFIFSLFISTVVFMHSGNIIGILLYFITINISTLILFTIYWSSKSENEKIDVRKMTIEDLE